MLAPHFKDEIAGLQKWSFQQVVTFFGAVFFIVTHIYRQTMYILQNDCSQMSFLAARRLQTFYTAVKCLLLISRMRLPAYRVTEMAFLAGFDLFWRSFLLRLIFMGKQSTFCKKLSPDVFYLLQGGSKHFTRPFRRVPIAYSIDKSKSQESVEQGNQLHHWVYNHSIEIYFKSK